MNLILCGMMGSGKTTVGKKLAECIEARWLDTDGIIEERYGKISELFKRYGEEYFRAKETEIVKEFAKMDGLVISTGGGLLLKEENAKLLKANGAIIFLRATLNTLLERLQGDRERPLLQNSTDLRLRLSRLLEERTPVYERVADYTVDVDKKAPDEIAKEIIGLTVK